MSIAPRSSFSARRRRRVASVAAAIAAAGLLVACGDDGSSTPVSAGTTEVATDTVATPATEPAPAADPTSLATLLAAAPDVDVDPEYPVYVTYGDLQATSDLIGLPRPSGDDPGAVLDWQTALILDRTGEGVQPAIGVLPRIASTGGADPAAMAAEIGWHLGEVSAFLEVTAGTEDVTLVTGDVTEADLAAVGTADGATWRVGDGEDFAVNIDARTPVRPLGEPLHLAWRDEIALVSRSTAAAAGFAAAGTSLVDAIPALADLAAPLDAQGVYGALFATVLGDDLLFDAFGAGQAVVDGQRIALFAYHAADVTRVAELEASVRDTLANGDPAFSEETWAELFPGAEVHVEDQVVLAVLPLAPTTPTVFVWRTVEMTSGLATNAE